VTTRFVDIEPAKVAKAEVAALERDHADRREMLAVAELMARLRDAAGLVATPLL